MLLLIEITPLHWAGFVACILFFLALDLGVFHRRAHVVSVKEASFWTTLWVSLSLLFAVGLRFARGEGEALEFITGYLIELSLSMDNVFVIALVFAYFRVPARYQHRVLFWGILGALLMRGVMIAAGAALVKRFLVTLYIFGAFLVITGVKMLFSTEEGVHPEKNVILRLARRLFPVSTKFDGQRFFTRMDGKRALTPLAMVLLMVETTDLIFAVDSIPAIFAVTRETFIVFTSNVFAILGLRSMYFLLAAAMRYFIYLKTGLSLVLMFIGTKMLIDPHDGDPKFWFQVHIPTSYSLAVVGAIILTSIAFSLVAARRRQGMEHEE